MNWENKKKDEILQIVNDIFEKHDWGGNYKKMIVKITFKGKFWMLEPEVLIKDTLDKKNSSVI